MLLLDTSSKRESDRVRKASLDHVGSKLNSLQEIADGGSDFSEQL